MAYTFYLIPMRPDPASPDEIAEAWRELTDHAIKLSDVGDADLRSVEWNELLRIESGSVVASVTYFAASKLGFTSDWILDFGRNLEKDEIDWLCDQLAKIDRIVTVTPSGLGEHGLATATAIVLAVSLAFEAWVTVTETWALKTVPTGLYRPPQLWDALPGELKSPRRPKRDGSISS